MAANVESYSNTGLTAATTYQYRVRAYNSGGNSAYSNTATATTNATAPGGAEHSDSNSSFQHADQSLVDGQLE